MERTILQALASTLQASANCEKHGNAEWFAKHNETINAIMDEAPSGSGIDTGTELDLDATNENKIVFTCGFHHMDENGCYDGWTEHKVIITPTFAGFDVRVTGRDRNQIKDYLADEFHNWLSKPLPEYIRDLHLVAKG